MQWKDTEFIQLMCMFMTKSRTTVVNPDILRILLPLVGHGEVATEVCQDVSVSEFTAQLLSVETLEVFL